MWWSSTNPVPEEWVGADVLLKVSLGIGDIFVNDAENGLGCLLWLHDLEHGVFVTSSLFAHLAKVEVLADGALVSDPDDRLGAASIADHSPVLLL